LTFKSEIQAKVLFRTLTNAGKKIILKVFDTSRVSKKTEVVHKTEHAKSVRVVVQI
jgi:hypothetical protein